MFTLNISEDFGNNNIGDVMNRLFKFGYMIGWFLLIVSLFFLFSVIMYYRKLTLFDVICTFIVVFVSVKYFIENVIYSYKYILRGEELFIYKGTRIKYQIDMNNIEISKGFFDTEKRIIFNSNNKIYEISIDYDSELLIDMNNINNINIISKKNNKRLKWHILIVLTILFIVISIIYVLFK